MNVPDRIADFLFEVGMLARTPRSGFEYLGTGRQSVAEHAYRTAVVGYALARLAGADPDRVVRLCLFHDLPEARTTDLHHLAKRYASLDESAALDAATRHLPFAPDVRDAFREWSHGDATESRLARDADRIELMLALKELLDLGNTRAREWLDAAEPRLETDTARDVARAIRSTPFDRWWRRDMQTD